jgi:hypothetical protein
MQKLANLIFATFGDRNLQIAHLAIQLIYCALQTDFHCSLVSQRINITTSFSTESTQISLPKKPGNFLVRPSKLLHLVE